MNTGYSGRPNAQVNRQKCEAFLSVLNLQLGRQPRSAVVVLRKADAEGMGALSAFEPCEAGLLH